MYFHIKPKSLLQESANTSPRILRMSELQARVGLSRCTIYQLIKKDRFPQPIPLGGGRAVGWLESEVSQWIMSRLKASRSETV